MTIASFQGSSGLGPCCLRMSAAGNMSGDFCWLLQVGVCLLRWNISGKLLVGQVALGLGGELCFWLLVLRTRFSQSESVSRAGSSLKESVHRSFHVCKSITAQLPPLIIADPVEELIRGSQQGAV